MSRLTRTAMAMMVLAGASSTLQAQSSQVYTWTDENGVVHFVDTPPENPNAVSIEVPEAYRPGSAGAYPEADATTEADAEDPALVENYADQKRQQLAQAREQAQAEQSERASACAQARARLAQIEPSRRVYYTNDQGETVRLDDEERVRLVAEAKLVAEENCN